MVAAPVRRAQPAVRLTPYRYPRQRYSTVVLRAPRRFVDEVLLPEFKALNEALTAYLNEVTLRLIREEIHGDASEAAEVAPALTSRPAAD